MNDAGTVLTEISGDPSYSPPPNAPNINPASLFNPAISRDGQFVSFWSTSAVISVAEGGATYTFNTGNTAETTAEVYVYDTVNHSLQEVSGVLGGVQGNGNSGTLSVADNNSANWASSLSADGRYVVFQSVASNLVAGAGDQNGVSNIFLYDTQTGKTQVVSLGLGGTAANGASYRPQISADGDYVTFASTATNLVAGGGNGQAQTYVYDTLTGAIALVSAAANGTPANNESDLASAVSADGSIVAFGSTASNLVTPDANAGYANIFVAGLNQAPGGTIDVTGTSTIEGSSTAYADLNNGTVTLGAQANPRLCHGVRHPDQRSLRRQPRVRPHGAAHWRRRHHWRADHQLRHAGSVGRRQPDRRSGHQQCHRAGRRRWHADAVRRHHQWRHHQRRHRQYTDNRWHDRRQRQQRDRER